MMTRFAAQAPTCVRRGGDTRRAIAAVTTAIVAALVGLGYGCSSELREGRASVGEAPGDAENGRLLLHQFDCGRCHRIPGVVAAQGSDAPSLDDIGRRVYLAGILPNTPENMMRWIGDPQSVDPDTQMPNLRVGEAHRRDMVAYLMTLR